MFRACMLDTVGSTFSGNKQQGYFSAIMKRYMSSKILYAPDNRHTRRIIKKVSDVIFIQYTSCLLPSTFYPYVMSYETKKYTSFC